jgi:hypothetical protein
MERTAEHVDGRAGRRQLQSTAPPDTTQAAGDDCDLTIEHTFPPILDPTKAYRPAIGHDRASSGSTRG